MALIKGELEDSISSMFFDLKIMNISHNLCIPFLDMYRLLNVLMSDT